MSSGISNPPANAFPCPNCGKYDSVIGPVDANIPTHSIEYCAHCKRPYVVQNVTRVVTSVHKIEGIETPTQKPLSPKCREFVDSNYKLPEIPMEEEVQQHIKENTYTCSKCGKEFVTDADVEPCELDDKIYCDECFDEIEFVDSRTQPDEEKFLCAYCGTLNDASVIYYSDDGLKICAACNDQKDRSWTDAPVEQEPPEPEYVPLPDSRTVSYCIDGDIIKLQYKGSDCNAYASDVIWDIVDSPQSKWMSRIDEILADEKNRIQKASALNQLCKAVGKGIVKIPGSDE
jgi:transcription elongation factor Elf1